MRAAHGRRTGAQPRSFDQAVPHWSSLRLAKRGVQAPPIPPALDWRDGLPAQLPIMLNGPTPGNPAAPILGDCTQVGLRRLRTAWKWNAGGGLVNDSDDLVEQGYSESTGYIRGRPDTDLGGNLQTVLKWAMVDGMPTPDGGRDKILGFIEIDGRHPQDIRRGLAECGGLYCAGALPASYMDINPGDSWTANAGPGVDGHCTVALSYDENGVGMDTWGFAVPTPEDALRYWDEFYAVISEDFIMSTGKTPFGMTMADIWATMGPLRASVGVS
jgi:hypothetical protein